MQKRTQQITLPGTKEFRAHGAPDRRSMHRRLAVVIAVLLLGVWVLARDTTEAGPGESP